MDVGVFRARFAEEGAATPEGALLLCTHEQFLRDDRELGRFLQADSDFERSATAVSDHLRWRGDYSVDSVLAEDFSEIESTGVIYAGGEDKHGHPCLVVRPCRYDGARFTLQRCTRFLVRCILKLREAADKRAPAQKITVIIDCLSTKSPPRMNLSELQSAIHLVSTHFPESLHAAYFVPCSNFVALFWGITRTHVSQKICAKVHLLAGCEALLADFDRSQLEQRFGGLLPNNAELDSPPGSPQPQHQVLGQLLTAACVRMPRMKRRVALARQPPVAHGVPTRVELASKLSMGPAEVEVLGALLAAGESFTLASVEVRPHAPMPTSAATQLVFTSPGFRVMSGYSREEVEGRDCSFLQRPAGAAQGQDGDGAHATNAAARADIRKQILVSAQAAHAVAKVACGVAAPSTLAADDRSAPPPSDTAAAFASAAARAVPAAAPLLTCLRNFRKNGEPFWNQVQTTGSGPWTATAPTTPTSTTTDWCRSVSLASALHRATSSRRRGAAAGCAFRRCWRWRQR